MLGNILKHFKHINSLNPHTVQVGWGCYYSTKLRHREVTQLVSGKCEI